MTSSLINQQPIGKTVGRRTVPPLGAPPGPQQRAAWDAMASYTTRTPKGVFRYRSHAELELDRERWKAEWLLARGR